MPAVAFNTIRDCRGGGGEAESAVAEGGKDGYRQWLLQALVATRWLAAQAEVDPAALCAFGGSQGGWGSLMLGSLLGPGPVSGAGAGAGAGGAGEPAAAATMPVPMPMPALRAVVANEPFLTHVPLMLDHSTAEHPVVAELHSLLRGASATGAAVTGAATEAATEAASGAGGAGGAGGAEAGTPAAGRTAAAVEWRQLGLFDTYAHAHRLRLPVLITTGYRDLTCPSPGGEALFRALGRLGATRALCDVEGLGHGLHPLLSSLTAAWVKTHTKPER